VTHQLTTRPSLEHLRGQAKTLLAELRAGDTAAAQAFIAHLPEAHDMSLAQARAAAFRLAHAQSVIARRNGFASWAMLTRQVQHLRALEGEWHFEALQVDGQDMPPAMLGQSKLLLDGDRFRMESPEATYDGRFDVDTSATPMHIDIDFVEGPEAGNHSYGLFELRGDRLTICLGLIGAARPTTFATQPGSGHALERLRRAPPARPAGVTGGDGVAAATRPTGAAPLAPVDASVDAVDFGVETSPMLARLEGKWVPVRIVTGGVPMQQEWLAFGSRTGERNEAKVVFGGQVMLHVKMRIDESVVPIAVDYIHLHGPDTGKASKGIMQWLGDDVCFLMAGPGRERPTDFASPNGPGLTLSQWKRVNR
jgi:uncharacterized protein (TIGR03067 family)